MKISIVIPCRNDEGCINKFYDAMQEVRQSLAEDFEYVFVDDGSSDNTLNLVKALARNDKAVRYIAFSRGFGNDAAVYAGLKAATGDFVGLMAIDTSPKTLLDMYKTLNDNSDCECVAYRTAQNKRGGKIRGAIYRLISCMSDVQVADGAVDCRLMTRKMAYAVLELSERERFSAGIFGFVGFKTKWLECNVDCGAGATRGICERAEYSVSGIANFSIAPLKFNLILAISLFVVTVLFTAFDIVWWCLDYPMYEWFILTPIVLLMSALLATGLAVISAYVKKIFTEVKARPIYIVRETESDLDRHNPEHED